jgi:hypothetical protein
MDIRKYTAEYLHKQCNNPDVLQKTVQQINRDFYSFGVVIELDIHAADAYYQFVDKVRFEVNRMIQQNSTQFFALAYRIDVSEKRVIEVLSAEGDHEKQLACILIEREVLKVLTKANFRP